jgi:hypothetical protein
MGKSNSALSAPERILAAARRAAKRDGVRLNQFINTALAEKVAALEAEDVFMRRAARADRARFLEVLERLGGGPPRLPLTPAGPRVSGGGQARPRRPSRHLGNHRGARPRPTNQEPSRAGRPERPGTRAS